MNIIQLQDRLKGLPEEALVKYVEQPMGEVPIYLALGELQRRSEMKKRFQATQADKPSVAEQLVAEAKPMQMGLGAMAPQQMMPGAQGVGAPQPTPEIDPRQMAASGIAANPVSNVGGPAMMANGGIVGYQTGGDIEDAISRVYDLNDGTRRDNTEELDLNRLSFNDNSSLIDDNSFIPNPFDKFKNLPISQNKSITDLDDSESLTDAELEAILGTKNLAVGNMYSPFPYDMRKLTGLPYFPKSENIKDFMTERKDINKELGIDNEYFGKQKDKALNMGLIEAGLRIAGGTSANPLANISEGAIPALAQYNKQIAAADAGTRAELINARDAFITKQAATAKIQADLLSDQLAANAVGAQTKSKYSLDALEFTRDYFKYFLKEGAVNTFYQQNKDIAAQTFQKVNKVIFDTISQGRAINVEEIQNIILERVPKK
jgi:hypothetical protein